ncbi:MAG: D-alanyl-D-alanine carboxypeptidase/D-alanyl-D-alanine-endopeptidase [Bacteroidetes bacterium]|nr:D-alanyl-D-alanine carboxypeptidase/D-alanyl-D-alanine-endopeptidase [Bacteroidota bacterium]
MVKYIDELKKEKTWNSASVGFCVLDAASGSLIEEYNKNISLTPASTLKIITTACALQILGKNFRYETLLQYSGNFDKASGTINGDLYIKGSGDPSLNSEYFRKAEDTFFVANRWAAVLKEKGIKKITGQIVIDVSCFEEDIPANWVWGDMGNYFGAGPNGLSYSDNKMYVVYEPSAKAGDSLRIKKTVPYIESSTIKNEVKAGGHEDNASAYRAPASSEIKITGTLPVSNKPSSIEVSMPHPEILLAMHLKQAMKKEGIDMADKPILKITAENKKQYSQNLTVLYNYKSPILEKIVAQTNLHSNNLYAESIFRTLAVKKAGWGSNWLAIQTVVNHLKSQGFDENGLFINDGSGLSRSNAVTAEHLSKLLHLMYSDTVVKNAFINSLPVAGVSGSLKKIGKGSPLENNFKAKSGYITRVRSYAGYMKTKSGKEICISLIVTNFNGSPSETRKKMEQIFLKVYELL